MKSLADYATAYYRMFNTSPEIMAAIEHMGEDSLLDHGGTARMLWENPSRDDEKAILDEAWKMTDADSLSWDGTAYSRPEPAGPQAP